VKNYLFNECLEIRLPCSIGQFENEVLKQIFGSKKGEVTEVYKLKRKDHLRDTGVDGRIILKCILEKQDVSVRV
jgi:hypothetical protein